MNTTRLCRLSSGQASSSTGGCARCCTNCTTTGPWQPSTSRKPFTRNRSGPRIAISVSMARAKTGHGIGALSVEHETADAVAECAASATKVLRASSAGSVSRRGIEFAVHRLRDFGARIERAQLRGERRGGAFAGDVGLGDHQPVGEDRLLARLRRPGKRVAAGLRRRPRSPPPRRGTLRRARGRWRRSAEWARDRRGREVSITMRLKSGISPRSRSITMRRSACCRSLRVMQHRQPLPSSTVSSALDAHQRVVDAGRAELVDHDRGALRPPASRESARSSVVLPAPRKPVTTVTGMRWPARALEPAPEQPGGGRGEEFVHGAITCYPDARAAAGREATAVRNPSPAYRARR